MKQNLNPELKSFLESASDDELKEVINTLERKREKSIEQMTKNLNDMMAKTKKPYKYVIIPEIGG